MVKLFCALVGAAGSAFSVRVDESNTIDDLKKAIKAEKPHTITCDADYQDLYLAKKGDREKGDAWTMNNEVGSVSDVVGLSHLNVPQAKLRRVGLPDEDMIEVDEAEEAAENGLVNVLVVVPTEQREALDQLPALVPTKKRRANLRIAYAGPLHLDEFSVPMETIAAFNDIQTGFAMEGSRGRPLYLLYGPRQFGKSTIAYRVADWMAADPHMTNVECIVIELRRSAVRDAATFWICLGMHIESDSVCQDEAAFIKLATRGKRRFCLILDEMDHLFDNKDLATTFLAALRTWKVASFFCGFLGVGSHDLVHHYQVFRGDMKSSFSNVGNMIEMEPFSLEQMSAFFTLVASLYPLSEWGSWRLWVDDSFHGGQRQMHNGAARVGAVVQSGCLFKVFESI